MAAMSAVENVQTFIGQVNVDTLLYEKLKQLEVMEMNRSMGKTKEGDMKKTVNEQAINDDEKQLILKIEQADKYRDKKLEQFENEEKRNVSDKKMEELKEDWVDEVSNEEK